MLSWYMQRDRERPLMTPRVVTLAVRWYMTYCRGQRGLSQREGEWHTNLMHTHNHYMEG